MNLSRREFIKSAGTAAIAASALPAGAALEAFGVTVAFVGLDHIHTPQYLNAVYRHPGVRIKYLWDEDPARAKARAGQVGATVPEQIETIWSDPEVQGVVILSATDRHKALVLAAAQAGKGMFVEKPLGINREECADMVLAVEKAGVTFTTGYFMRTDPMHLFLKDEVAKGHFGTISRVWASNCHNGSLAGFFDHDWQWMADPKRAGVGAFGDLGTHKLDILMWIFGDVEKVTGLIEPVTRRYGDCDESGEALLQFKSGLAGSLAAGWVDIEDPVKLLISGTEGHAVIFRGQLFYRSLHLPGSSGQKPWQDFPKGPDEPIDQFLNTLAGSKDQPLVSIQDAASRVNVMSTIYAAAASGQWLKVPPV